MKYKLIDRMYSSQHLDLLFAKNRAGTDCGTACDLLDGDRDIVQQREGIDPPEDENNNQGSLSLSLGSAKMLQKAAAASEGMSRTQGNFLRCETPRSTVLSFAAGECEEFAEVSQNSDRPVQVHKNQDHAMTVQSEW